VALQWIKEGVKNVTTVYNGEWAMRGAGFTFPSTYQNN